MSLAHITELAYLRSRFGVTRQHAAALAGVSETEIVASEEGGAAPSGRLREFYDSLAAAESGPVVDYGEVRGRPILLPGAQWKSGIDGQATVRLPTTLDWSRRRDPDRDLSDDTEKAGTYATVLDVGQPRDIRFWTDPDDLARLWSVLPLARYLRQPVHHLLTVTLGYHW